MKRILKIIPLLIVIAAIILLTFQDVQGTIDLSEGFRDWAVGICDRYRLDTVRGWIDSSIAIRRVGHIIEYFALGVAAAISIKKKIFALLLCLCISIGDQVIKMYVPGRHFDLFDLPFDAAGYVTGILLVTVICLIGGKRETK